MGNNTSCCVTNSSPKEKYFPPVTPPAPPPEPPRPASTINLQHISEREPDETCDDPSVHPTANTIFLTRSKSEMQKSRIRRQSYYDNRLGGSDFGLSKKFSSCSTIYIDDSTVSQPNLKNTIKAVALAIYFHIKNRQNATVPSDSECLLDIFDERLHPLCRESLPEDYELCDPEHKTIYRFIRTLFNAALLTAECAIVTLVYLERLLTYAEIEIVPINWKRITLGAILLASKVWDDQAVWNVDYCQILKDISVEDMNELERQFLEMLQFNINVPSSVYAKYYFDLRALADAHDLSFPLEPLSRERSDKLEAMSSQCGALVAIQYGMKRAQSLDCLMVQPTPAKAILS